MKKEDMKQYSVNDTLYFFYFGITPDEIGEDGLLKKVINKALFDATMQGAFNTKVLETDKDNANSAKEQAVSYLEERIKGLNSNNQKEYDKWHSETCICVKCKFKDLKDKNGNMIFSYGNAQKFVNMTMKYLYMLSKSSGLANSNSKLVNAVKKSSKFFHMPIDSYIIDQLCIKEILDKEIQNRIKRKQLPKKKPLKDCSHPSEYIKPWSQWESEEYVEVQECIRKKADKGQYIVIDWENDLWIERAKILRP